MMKKLIVAAVLIPVLASPALAQKHRVHANTRANETAKLDTDNGFSGGPNGEVVWGSKVRAQDPDVFIRSQIARGLGNYGAD
jgi:hypothetical protein